MKLNLVKDPEAFIEDVLVDAPDFCLHIRCKVRGKERIFLTVYGDTPSACHRFAQYVIDLLMKEEQQ